VSGPDFSGARLDLRDVTKIYGDVTAVGGVSLSVNPGEFLTLLGPSGSGKTTTLNIIAGFSTASTGEVTMDGEDLAGLPPHRRNIGMVFQQYALFPHMTVAGNVAFPLKQRRMPRHEIRELVQEALDLVRLGDLADRMPAQLSGGQQQRVALARAIVFRPRLLLMDEPLGALDRKLREWLQLEIRRIHQELGITFVYVTHDQDEALVLSDRIAVFNDGGIEQIGSASEVYEHPSTLFVAEFVGESTATHGHVARSGSRACLRAGELELKVDGEPPDGQAAALVVRPERVRVAAPSERPGPEENSVSGVVRRVIYLGLARKLEVEGPGGQMFLAREPAGGHSTFSEGDRVLLLWRVEDAVLLPTGAPANSADRAPAAEAAV
jgi:putative spermidine/putrescine transport system ATP-binding protein